MAILILGTECREERSVRPRVLIPQNIRMVINDDRPATNDTTLKVSISGNFIHRMKVSWDREWEGAQWIPYQEELGITVPKQEGIVSVWGQFASSEQGTTGIYRDDILLDFRALIAQFQVVKGEDTLRQGSALQMMMETGEEGRGWASIGDIADPYYLSFTPPGFYTGEWRVPRIVPSDRFTITAHFIDLAGNQAVPVTYPDTFILSGEDVKMRRLGSLSFPQAHLQDVLVDQGYAILTDNRKSIYVVDINNADNPTLIRAVSAISPGGMAKKDNLLFVADGEGGVAIYTYASPPGMGLSRHINVAGIAKDVLVRGEFLYIGTTFDGVWTYEVKQLGQFQFVSHASLTGYGEKLLEWGDHLIVIGHSGFAILQLTDPASPKKIWEGIVPGSVQDGVILGDFLVLATRDTGVIVYQLHESGLPEVFASHSHLGSPTAVNGTGVFLWSGTNNTLILSLGGSMSRLRILDTINILSPCVAITPISERSILVAEKEALEIFAY